MKTQTGRLLTGLAVAMYATAASAQTTGTVTVTGTTPEAFAITSVTDGSLSSTIALGTLTPATGATTAALTPGTATLRLRSNKAYKLTAQAAALSITSAGAADGGSAIALTDIGFGIVSVTATGANVASGHTDTVVSGFDVSGGWATPTDGLTPAFTKTLNDITSGAQILSGSRISARGNLSTSNNFISVVLGTATMPQFFTPNSGFSSVITLTIASQ